jgi:hypothetical protein
MSRKLCPSSALLSRWTTPPTGWRCGDVVRRYLVALPADHLHALARRLAGEHWRQGATKPGNQPLHGRLSAMEV